MSIYVHTRARARALASGDRLLEASSLSISRLMIDHANYLSTVEIPSTRFGTYFLPLLSPSSRSGRVFTRSEGARADDRAENRSRTSARIYRRVCAHFSSPPGPRAAVNFPVCPYGFSAREHVRACICSRMRDTRLSAYGLLP